MPPYIFSPDQCETLMQYVQQSEPDSMAWFVVCLFSGVRPHEADKLTWDSIKGDKIVIDAAASKVRRRRIVGMKPNAKSWLAFAHSIGSRLPLPHATRRKSVRRVRDALKLKAWPVDVLRHTCASYWIADVRDVARVALELGNSPSVLLRHYMELVSHEDAAKFWQIYPKHEHR
ncbi:MAG: hypothetical protein IT579_08105 [Verrucomicrobia subdivision 3 bacterium]|nr:hypothetical protein [Limisphaerales bacterium]